MSLIERLGGAQTWSSSRDYPYNFRSAWPTYFGFRAQVEARIGNSIEYCNDCLLRHCWFIFGQILVSKSEMVLDSLSSKLPKNIKKTNIKPILLVCVENLRYPVVSTSSPRRWVTAGFEKPATLALRPRPAASLLGRPISALFRLDSMSFRICLTPTFFVFRKSPSILITRATSATR